MKVLCKSTGRPLLSEHNGEVYVAQQGQVISLCLHASKHVAVSIVRVKHFTAAFPEFLD